VKPASVKRSTADLERSLRSGVEGEVRFDEYTRYLFSTDASMYSIDPIGVVSPRHEGDAAAVLEIAGQFGVPVLPRGGGTSLAGQTVGKAVVMDFSRHMHSILQVSPENQWALVQPGVVQDDLNRAVAPYSLWFAPDTSTANRATIGGMIGNNSCGARSARYGMTIDHVMSLNVLLADASSARFDAVSAHELSRRARGDTLEGRLYREIPKLVQENADVIRKATPLHWRRSGGYRLERVLPEAGPFNLASLVVGSEGTLAVTVAAKVRLVPKPAAIAALVGHFPGVQQALKAAPTAIERGAAAVELIDGMILDLARASPVHGHRAGLLNGRPGAILWVEFYGASVQESTNAMRALEQEWMGSRQATSVITAPTAREQAGFRELRKAGLGLLMTGGLEGERSIAFVEDTAVDPHALAEYTQELSGVLTRRGLRAGFYGHASAGCLHIRPFMDLRKPRQVEMMREIAEEVLELVMKFGGMNSSEHGDGLARGEFNPRFFGQAYYDVMRAVKRAFDPEGRLNPGKKVDVPTMTSNLREAALALGPRPLTELEVLSPEGVFGSANRCMRIGACRKSSEAGGTMCPSYMATREEEHSTRGRANALVHALSAPDPEAALASHEVQRAMDLCLECKACQVECPLSVDMARMKSEALAHHYARYGTPLRARVFGHVRKVNQAGSLFAPLSNILSGTKAFRTLLEQTVGIDRRRPLPRFERETLPVWFKGRARNAPQAAARDGMGRLALLADCFTSYTEPEIGQAAVQLLESVGWRIELIDDVCCGRSFISKGLLKEARERQTRLVSRLGPLARDGVPIVGCEPSCIFTLKDELQGMVEPSADRDAVAREARIVDDLLADAIDSGAIVPTLRESSKIRTILLHAHCHQKAARALGGTVGLLTAIPKTNLEVLDAGCCGMAGAFGFEVEHYDMSMKIGGLRLFPAIGGIGTDVVVAATGVSCRQQIYHGTGVRARHPANILLAAAGV
jgi:FAD/FMN-containing dehydrogenase/Fe-S oxidoreductase